ncbi:hypothetical protein ACJMK2_013631, partial [Sinanodonta woodiana]
DIDRSVNNLVVYDDVINSHVDVFSDIQKTQSKMPKKICFAQTFLFNTKHLNVLIFICQKLNTCSGRPQKFQVCVYALLGWFVSMRQGRVILTICSSKLFPVMVPLIFSTPNTRLYIVFISQNWFMDLTDIKKGPGKPEMSQIDLPAPNSTVVFDKAENSSLMLEEKSKGKQQHQLIINPDWDLSKLGIGGLDKEFSAIFRRAVASRVFPPEDVEQLGMKHVKGILLFGPPGTGKTLMARQIGKLLNAREPKFVNGPQILDKYVGESEANIHNLFADAEDEEKRCGPMSSLHIIIIDEIDAICKTRGSVAGNTGVNDTVVNQLLAKIDGVEQLNNILVIGMTNRKDMIDEALLRPGRLELHVEIGLPDESGRVQILNIHTATMRKNNKLASDVDIQEIAALTKNFSGAEIEALVKISNNKVEVDPDAGKKWKLCRADFMHALEHDIKPAFGSSKEEFEKYVSNGIIKWGMPVNRVLEAADMFIALARSSDRTPLVKFLLEGSVGTGKTALAVQIAKNADFPFIKICSIRNMIGFHESEKCQFIKKIFDDAYKSPLSCIILDDIEQLLDFVPTGPRVSNLIFQALLALLATSPPDGHKLLIIGTTSRKDVLQEMEILNVFHTLVHVSSITSSEHLINVVENIDAFTRNEVEQLKKKTNGKSLCIGIKNLLELIGRVKPMEENQRIVKFLCLLEEEGGLEP